MLDLVDDRPEEAIVVIRAYIFLYLLILPDGVIDALYDCIEIIRAKCLTSSGNQEVIDTLSSRDFEHLVEQLYDRMGYETMLTPPSFDGGYDIVASKVDKGLKTTILIDAKHYREPVGVEIARQMQGTLASQGASKGVIVTTSKFTRGALQLEKNDSRLELINRQEFIQLMNRYYGVDWTSKVDRLIVWSKRKNQEKQSSKE